MDVQQLQSQNEEPAFRRIHDALPSVRDGANAQSTQQEPSHRTGVAGGAIIDTSTQHWALHDAGAGAERAGLAGLALSYPREFGEHA